MARLDPQFMPDDRHNYISERGASGDSFDSIAMGLRQSGMYQATKENVADYFRLHCGARANVARKERASNMKGSLTS
jgi:hypothetical protein